MYQCMDWTASRYILTRPIPGNDSPCLLTYPAVHDNEKPSGKSRISSRENENLYCLFRAEKAKIGIHFSWNSGANLVFLTKWYKIFKNWTFCVLDVLYPGHPVTGRLVNGRFVSGRFVPLMFCNWAFGNWIFCNWTLCNWRFCGCTLWRLIR